MGNRNIFDVDNARVARCEGIARALRHVVVHVDNGKVHRLWCILRRGLVIPQIADGRLVVDREHGDRRRRGCGLRRRGLVGHRNGKRIRTIIVRVRRVENRVVRAQRRGAVLRGANCYGRRVAVHLIIARQCGKTHVRILADRPRNVADNRRVVLRRNGQVNRLFHVGKPVADANDDHAGTVHVGERMYRNGLALRRHLRGVPGLEHDGRARGGGPCVDVEMQVGSCAVDVVEGYVKRSGRCRVLQHGDRGRRAVDDRRIVDRIYGQPDDAGVGLRVIRVRNRIGDVLRTVGVCIRRKDDGVRRARLYGERAERAGCVDRQCVIHGRRVAHVERKFKRVAILQARDVAAIRVERGMEHNSNVDGRRCGAFVRIRFVRAVDDAIGKGIRSIRVCRNRRAFIQDGSVGIDRSRAERRLALDAIGVHRVAVRIIIVAQHVDRRIQLPNFVWQGHVVVPGNGRVVDRFHGQHDARGCGGAAIRYGVAQRLRSVPLRIWGIGNVIARAGKVAVRGGGNGGHPNCVAVRVRIIAKQIQNSGGIFVEFLCIVDRYRRVVLRENVQRKAGGVVRAFGIRRGHGNGHGAVAVRNRRERQRIFAAAKARHRNMACVYHELARVAGGNGDGKRIPYVLIRNGKRNAADRLVFAHILAVDRRDHRIMQHALDVHRNRRGGLVRAVRNGVGKRWIVVLANRGRIGKLLRRFVKRQRAQ